MGHIPMYVLMGVLCLGYEERECCDRGKSIVIVWESVVVVWESAVMWYSLQSATVYCMGGSQLDVFVC